MVKLIWITPNADQIIGDLARVSSRGNEGKDPTRLIKYMVENKHWSPFEMASACFEIETSRAVAHQILRHRSFSFQEFSQRYAKPEFTDPIEVRIEHPVDRQSSIPLEPGENNYLTAWWHEEQLYIINAALTAYDDAISYGVAKEVARMLLPEGLTKTRMYMSGTIRSWIHYLDIRTEDHTQVEHRIIAGQIQDILESRIPITMAAVLEEK